MTVEPGWFANALLKNISSSFVFQNAQKLTINMILQNWRFVYEYGVFLNIRVIPRVILPDLKIPSPIYTTKKHHSRTLFLRE